MGLFIKHFIWKQWGYTFFVSAHGTFPRVDHMLGHKTRLRKLNSYRTPFPTKMLMRLEINYKGFSSGSRIWEINYMGFSAKESSWQCKRNRFDPWSRKIPHTMEQLSPLDFNEIKPVNSKRNQSWIFIGRTDGEAEAPILWPPDAKKLTHWKRPWCWERLKVGGKGYDRGWDGWMASLTQWMWVWASPGSWWYTGKSGLLQSMVLQRVRHYWTSELNWRYT